MSSILTELIPIDIFVELLRKRSTTYLFAIFCNMALHLDFCMAIVEPTAPIITPSKKVFFITYPPRIVSVFRRRTNAKNVW